MAQEIRPHASHAIYQTLATADRCKLVADSAGRWVRRFCPACTESHSHKLFVNEDFAYHACAACDTVYMPFLPPPDILAAYYRSAASSTFFHEKILLSSQDVRRESVFRPRVKLVQRFVQTGSWLDIGCAIGTSLEAVRDAGFTGWGIEMNAAARQHAQGLGFRVEDCDVEQLSDASGSLAVITLFEVVAHLADPLLTLAACARLLSPDGVLVLTTPNVEGYEYRVLGRHHHNLLFPFLNLFHFHALKHLLAKAGFVVVEHATPGSSDVATICKICAAQGLQPNLSALEQKILFGPADADRHDFQEMLRRLYLSGHQQVVAKKQSVK